MNKEEIIIHLKRNHAAFIDGIDSLNENEFNFAPAGKWNTGQTLDHLGRAVGALASALTLPLFLFAGLFGKANRPSKTYDGLVTRYKEKLAAGGKAHSRYLPKKISYADRKKAFAALQKSVDKICRVIGRYSEEQLDNYILPHPLLGKITLREMMFFTIYHAEHHRLIILRDVAVLQSS